MHIDDKKSFQANQLLTDHNSLDLDFLLWAYQMQRFGLISYSWFGFESLNIEI